MDEEQEEGIYVGESRWGSSYKESIGRRKVVTNYCRLRGGKDIGQWWGCKVGQVAEAECPRCGEAGETPDHIVIRCREIRKLNDERGRREWMEENYLRWGRGGLTEVGEDRE